MSNGTVIRVNKTSNYTVMSNQHFHVLNMSLKAKGLLSMVLSLPDSWNYSVSGLTAVCKESRGTINSVLKELKELGYLEVKRINSENGQFKYEYTFHEHSIYPEKVIFNYDK